MLFILYCGTFKFPKISACVHRRQSSCSQSCCKLLPRRHTHCTLSRRLYFLTSIGTHVFFYTEVCLLLTVHEYVARTVVSINGIQSCKISQMLLLLRSAKKKLLRISEMKETYTWRGWSFHLDLKRDKTKQFKPDISIIASASC